MLCVALLGGVGEVSLGNHCIQKYCISASIVLQNNGNKQSLTQPSKSTKTHYIKYKIFEHHYLLLIYIIVVVVVVPSCEGNKNKRAFIRCIVVSKSSVLISLQEHHPLNTKLQFFNIIALMENCKLSIVFKIVRRVLETPNLGNGIKALEKIIQIVRNFTSLLSSFRTYTAFP